MHCCNNNKVESSLILRTLSTPHPVLFLAIVIPFALSVRVRALTKYFGATPPNRRGVGFRRNKKVSVMVEGGGAGGGSGREMPAKNGSVCKLL
jgi:hypothetical protein